LGRIQVCNDRRIIYLTNKTNFEGECNAERYLDILEIFEFIEIYGVGDKS